MQPIVGTISLAFLQGMQAVQGVPENQSVFDRMLDGFKQASTTNFLVLSGLLFVIGLAGVLTRRNIIIILMCIELMLNAANLNFIVFARYWQSQGGIYAINGQLFTIFIIVVAAAEAAIGLGIVIAFYRNRETVAVDEIDLLKW